MIRGGSWIVGGEFRLIIWNFWEKGCIVLRVGWYFVFWYFGIWFVLVDFGVKFDKGDKIW